MLLLQSQGVEFALNGSVIQNPDCITLKSESGLKVLLKCFAHCKILVSEFAQKPLVVHGWLDQQLTDSVGFHDGVPVVVPVDYQLGLRDAEKSLNPPINDNNHQNRYTWWILNEYLVVVAPDKNHHQLANLDYDSQNGV